MAATECRLADLPSLVGLELGTTRWLLVTQDRINTFAAATDDHQWLHVDVERAARGPFGGTIAPGYLTVALISPLFAELLQVSDLSMAVNYGLERVRFPAPVPAGSLVRLRATLVDVAQVRDAVQITVDFVFEVDGSAKPACVARGLFRYYP